VLDGSIVTGSPFLDHVGQDIDCVFGWDSVNFGPGEARNRSGI